MKQVDTHVAEQDGEGQRPDGQVVEPHRAEPQHAEQHPAEPQHAEPQHAEPHPAEPHPAEPQRSEQPAVATRPGADRDDRPADDPPLDRSPSPEAGAGGQGEAEARPGDRRRRRDKGLFMRLLNPEGVEWGANVGDFDPALVERDLRRMGAFFGDRRRYFRVAVEGWHHVPVAPAMVVSNHSGGTLFLDAWGLLYVWYAHFGTRRPLHPAAHEIIVGSHLGRFFASRGVIRADWRVAERVLTRWKEDLLVMPGGDLDVWRPYSRRYEVEFAGRTGYARLAMSSNTPVVPLANAGAQETFVVLTDGRKIAEALRLPQIARAHIWPIHLSLPWGLGIGPLPHIPLPVKLRYRFGPAIHPSDFGAEPGVEPTGEQVAEFDRAVRLAVQEQLHALRDARR